MATRQTTTYCIDGLCCAEEETLIRKKLARLRGVDEITFNLISRRIVIVHACSSKEIVSALRTIGFSVRRDSGEQVPQPSWWEKYNHILYAAVSGISFLTGVLIEFAKFSGVAANSFFIIAIIAGGWKIGVRGWSAARQPTLDMNVLMTIATIGAAAIGKWEEGAAVVFLFALSQLLERFSLERSRRAIHSLLALAPPLATVERNGCETTVRVEELQIGERLIIRPGERIPLDGTVVAGDSTVNQAPITGESIPLRKRVGDDVYAGTLNERGTLEITTTRPYFDTTLARVVRMVEEAQARRAPIQQSIDRFARYYTPAVISLAVFVAVLPPIALQQPFGHWFYRALVLLVIACPCALVISVPVTILSGLANAARNGILLKGGCFLEEIGRVNAIAFDKTGTLTYGRPRVTDIVPLDSLSQTDILRLTAAVEAKSEHHIAGAILQRAYEQHLRVDNVSCQNFETLTGRGVKATVNGVAYFLGSHALIEEQGICSPRVEEALCRLEDEGKTTIVLGSDEGPLGIIAIADEVRSESKEIVEQLHAEGIQRVIMLTGDNRGTATAIAAKIGIDEFYPGMLPEEKAVRVRDMKDSYGSVAMVGDGMNDAPALVESTVGIAMGHSGTDVALETADIVLMSDDLSKLPYLMRLGKHALAIIKQNIALALVIKVLFIALAVLGSSTLWMAVLADDGVTLLVIINGLRVLRLREVQ
ncbi:MAG: cadmium-translocating P-type ATPase [Ignavibacteriae bacterium]|nr:cadmium-translocating P-type ATPase [Ignavibacteria bacterium]MBI3365296.1 cadmium-translocating P-type ATPase [Ignavibacteriota bacterium]